MKTSHHISHEHHKAGFSYPVSFVQRLYALVLGPLAVVLLTFFVAKYFALGASTYQTLSFHDILLATLLTISRIGIAYALAVVVAIPLALLATSTDFLEMLFLPVFDILESIPILAFFPIIILVFIKFNFLNGAAVLILFLSMLWNIVFTLVGGLKIIPVDIKYAAQVFGVKRFSYLNKILLPAIFPQLVTGSILAVAQGWNIIIVAEVLHVYIPQGTSSQDLFGIGSLLVQAAANSQTHIFITVVMIMILVIAATNFFVWQKLLKYAQRYRFE